MQSLTLRHGVLISTIADILRHGVLISTIADILRHGVNSLAQWLEHWISTPAIQVRITSGIFSNLCIIS